MTTDENDRYMDHIRVFLLALKAGWRWEENCEEWKKEDEWDGKSPTRRTAENWVKAMSCLIESID